MKKWIVLLILVGAGFGGYYGWKNWQKAKVASAVPDRPTTATAELRDIDFAVNAAGEISPAEQVSVRPEINGKIELLPVDIGDRVKKDDILFKLDDKELQQQKASNLTEIERAKLELAKAERDYKRAEELQKEKLISQELYDNTRTTYELAKVALDRANKDLSLIEERLTKTEVRAPFDCTILTRPVSMGQAVSGSGGFNSGTEVLTIADLNSMIINAQVNQADVPRLKPEQTVEVTVEAVAGLKVTGVVERISPQATIRNNIKGYPARIVLRNVDPQVRPGMTANVKIPVASAGSVTALPLSAVFTEKNPDTGLMERFVYLTKDNGYEKRNVKVGISDYFYAEIQEGLAAGEVVALEMPKEEIEKRTRLLAGGKEGGPPAPKTAHSASTNAPKAASTTPAGSPAIKPATGARTNTPASTSVGGNPASPAAARTSVPSGGLHAAVQPGSPSTR
jgi:RND family efflux transporter MFP subunit